MVGDYQDTKWGPLRCLCWPSDSRRKAWDWLRKDVTFHSCHWLSHLDTCIVLKHSTKFHGFVCENESLRWASNNFLTFQSEKNQPDHHPPGSLNPLDAVLVFKTWVSFLRTVSTDNKAAHTRVLAHGFNMKKAEHLICLAKSLVQGSGEASSKGSL